MFSSADLIEALRRRRRRSLRPERPAGEFPPGWSAWFASMRVKADAVTGATAEAILAILSARAPRLPPTAVAELGRWRAFASLWRQQWHPESEDERGVRIFATVLSMVLHILFVMALIWLMFYRYIGIAPAEQQRGERVVQVEFIGEGTPEDSGGGPPQAQPAEPAPAPAAASAAPAPAETPTPPTPPSPEVPPPAVAEVQPPQPPTPAPAAQPLQVTETPTPDTTFVVPPTRPIDVPAPRVETPELSARTREITVIEVPEIRSERRLPQREIAAPDLQQPPTELVEREIPAPLPQLRTPSVAPAPIAAPELRRDAPALTTREIPMPAAGRAPTPAEGETGAAAAPAAAAARDTAAQPAGGTPAASSGRQPTAPASGSGLATSPRPGALPSPRRGDDWGDAARDRPGGQAGQPGLFNADGSPRLAGSDGRVGGGLPPGTITEDYEKIDRMGTWLKRPPIGYEPTSFDRFWIPHENLLQEWVRKNIREALIPIPGTSKQLRCVVSLLQLGGGCGIVDPNMQDIEAGARKPPDVPFKPELQEDPSALP